MIVLSRSKNAAPAIERRDYGARLAESPVRRPERLDTIRPVRHSDAARPLGRPAGAGHRSVSADRGVGPLAPHRFPDHSPDHFVRAPSRAAPGECPCRSSRSGHPRVAPVRPSPPPPARSTPPAASVPSASSTSAATSPRCSASAPSPRPASPTGSPPAPPRPPTRSTGSASRSSPGCRSCRAVASRACSSPTAAAEAGAALAVALRDGPLTIVDVGVADSPVARAVLEVSDASLLVRARVLPRAPSGRRRRRSTGRAFGLVVLQEPGRALGPADVAQVLGRPVTARVPMRVAIARAVDAGRPPDAAARAARRGPPSRSCASSDSPGAGPRHDRDADADRGRPRPGAAGRGAPPAPGLRRRRGAGRRGAGRAPGADRRAARAGGSAARRRAARRGSSPRCSTTSSGSARSSRSSSTRPSTRSWSTDPGRCFVERAGAIEAVPLQLDDAGILRLAQRILAPLALRLDRSSPMVDARLPDGSRLHAVIPPLAIDGPCLTIRRFGARRMGLDAFGVDRRRRRAARGGSSPTAPTSSISGGTGSGKTTLLNALAGSPRRRPSASSRSRRPRSCGSRSRTSSGSRRGRPTPRAPGAFTVRDLVRAALRMRPDRLVVGEVRGAEALDLLQALNTGHDGSISTVHANSPLDALRRLSTLALFGGTGLPHDAICEQLRASVDVVVQVARGGAGGAREVVAVVEVVDAAGTVRGPAAAGADRGRASRSRVGPSAAAAGGRSGDRVGSCAVLVGDRAGRGARPRRRAAPSPRGRARRLRPRAALLPRAAAARSSPIGSPAPTSTHARGGAAVVVPRRGRRRVVRAAARRRRCSCPAIVGAVVAGPVVLAAPRRPCRSAGARRAARRARPRRRAGAGRRHGRRSRCTRSPAGRARSARTCAASRPACASARRSPTRSARWADERPVRRGARRRPARSTMVTTVGGLGRRPARGTRRVAARRRVGGGRGAARCRRRRGCRRRSSGSRRSRTSRSPRWRIRRRRGCSSPRPPGRICLVVGLALEALAAVWMRALVRAT